MNAISGCLIGALACFASSSWAGFYSDEASFYADVDAVHVNNFDDVVSGSSGDLSYSSGAYSYTVSAIGSGDQTLSNLDGIVSTSSDVDQILVTFTGAAVTAVGGNIWGVDISGSANGYLILNLDDGSTSTFTATGPHNFRGYSSLSAIQSISFDVPSGASEIWAVLDNLVIGTIPAPGVCALLGVVSLGAARRSRSC